MNTTLLTSLRSHLVALACAAAAATATSHAEIVFVPLDDVPIEDRLVLSNGPFVAELSDEFCQWVWDNVQILFPGCYIANCGNFGDRDDDGSVDNFAYGEPIGTSVRYTDSAIIAGFDVVDIECVRDPNACEFVPLQNEWLDRSGAPVRGYMAWGGSSSSGQPHYGWIDLTVEYDPAENDFDVYLHGYAYEDAPGQSIAAGDRGTPCADLDGDGAVDLGDLARLLANFGVGSGASFEDGDLDGDEAVNLTDLSLLLAQFGLSCD